MNYEVVETENDLPALQEQVIGMMRNGWLPTGGITILVKGMGIPWYYQAMYKVDKLDK